MEVGWNGRRGVWKKTVDEVYVDIQTYIRHPSSKTMFFVIVDDARDIPDPRQLERELSEARRSAAWRWT